MTIILRKAVLLGLGLVVAMTCGAQRDTLQEHEPLAPDTLVQAVADSLAAVSPHNRVRFLDVEVAGDLHAFVEQMRCKGFAFVSRDEKTLVMQGKYMGSPSTLTVYFTPVSHTVYSVSVMLAPVADWRALQSQYQFYRRVMVQRHGEPGEEFSFFSFPYKEGDGKEMEAVNQDKCNYTAYFFQPNGDIIDVGIFPGASVGFDYWNWYNAKMVGDKEEELRK